MPVVSDDDVVISGLSGRFPLSDNLEEFANNLYNGVDMVTADDSRYPIGYWDLPSNIAKVKSYHLFDADFFGYSKEESYWIDPKERVMLETTYEALIDAGIDPRTLRGSNTGVYHGSCFQEPHIAPHNDPSEIGFAETTMVSRISYHFDLKGPVFHIDTACASSFCSFHEAVMAVKTGYCDQAIVTGSNTCFQPFVTSQMQDLRMISPHGTNKSLDASADGYVRSEAVVSAIIQRRQQAKRIYATVLNSKSNCDGFKPEGITFPGTHAQQNLVRETYEEIGLKPDDIQYIEAHATGTAAGDPIELNSMHEILCKKKREKPILIGCVKSNIGHGEGASGMCALTKAMLIFQRKLIPPNMHYKDPNPEIKGLMDGTFVPVTKETPMPSNNIIALNSFGFGGSNIHTVVKGESRHLGLESKLIAFEDLPRLIQVCGRSAEAVEHIYEMIQKKPKYQTREFLYLLNEFAKVDCARGMSFRGSMIVTRSKAGSLFECSPATEVTETKPILLYFVDTQNIYSHEYLIQIPTFARTVQRSAMHLKSVKLNLLQMLRKQERNEVENIICNVALQLAFVDVLKALKIKPQGFSGHAYGEIASAYFCDCINLREALLIAYNAATFGKCGAKLRDNLKKILVDPELRPDTWFSSGSKYVSAEFFASKLTAPTNGLKPFSGDTIVLNVSCGGISEKYTQLIHKDPITDFLRLVGKLYKNGEQTCIETLYPAVLLPLPSSVPSLSPLLKWRRNHSFPLHKTHLLDTSAHGIYTMMVKNIPFHFDPRSVEDSFLLDHKIDGRILFPATGYLMLAYSTYVKLLSIPLDDVPIEFVDVSFMRMTVLAHDKEVSFHVRCNEETGKFEIKESEAVVATGTIRRLDTLSDMHPTMKNFLFDVREPSKVMMSMRDIYKEYRVRGYDYEPYFQGILSARSDGKEGSVIWRDIMHTTARDNFPMQKSEDYADHWLRSWACFVDCMTQFNLLSNKKGGRGMFVPTDLKSLICYPKLLKENIEANKGHGDTLVLGESSHLKVYTNSTIDSIYTKGLVVTGLKTRMLRRTQEVARANIFRFTPFNETMTLDQEDKNYVTSYFDKCLEFSEDLANGNFPGEKTIKECEDMFSGEDEKHSLIKCLIAKAKGEEVSKADLSKDLIVGLSEDAFFYPDKLIRSLYDLVAQQLFENKETQIIKYLEVSRTEKCLASVFSSVADKALLADKVSSTYSLLTTETVESKPAEVESLYNVSTIKKIPASDVIVYKMFDSSAECAELFTKLYEATRVGGFMIAFAHGPLPSDTISDMARDIDPKLRTLRPDLKNVVNYATSAGFTTVLKKQLFEGVLTLNVILFKKQPHELKVEDQFVLQVAFDDYSWIHQLKSLLSQANKLSGSRVWLIPKPNEESAKGRLTGVLGFAKSLRLEPGGENVRSVVDWRLNGKLDFKDKKYSHLLTHDMMYNVYDEDMGCWGSYEHFTPTDSDLVKTTGHLYLKPLKPGDLTSLVWAKHNVDFEQKGRKVEVYYAPLNFKDVLYATGKLPIDSVSGISPVIAQDSLLGLEFAGVDQEGNRVMGSVPYKALATTVVLDEESFVFPVPKTWTLEEAATVPVVYMTALYSLVICGKMTRDESVLIHAGAGGVGLAAIQLALGKGCNVFTTVGSPEKRKYLLSQFPELRDENVLNSRDIKFEEQILKATNGRGVDIVLNSLADDKLQASLRCLAEGGRFLEIGKVDMLKDTGLQGTYFDCNRTIFGIFVDSFFNLSGDGFVYQRAIKERKWLHKLVMDGLESGIIRPLKRTVFEMDKAEDAFRFMATGKHIGKVVLKIRDEATHSLVLPAVGLSTTNVTYFYSHKSYVVIGGLGGFGLEICQWMAEKGARNIVILGRRGIREPYQQYCVDRMRDEFGVNVLPLQWDIRSEEGIKAVIQEASKLGPVGGYFNIAAVYNDALFEDQTEDTWDASISPKARASYYFDKLSREMCPEMDYFVCFSSLSAARGNPGQTNYNFGNSFMDSICERRRKRGLHGLSIQWGVIGDVGEVTERTGGNGTILLGSTSQRMPSCLAHLDSFIMSKGAVFSCCIKANDVVGNAREGTDVLKLLSRVMGMKNIQTVDTSSTLASLGIDSLMAVEIQQIIERNTGEQMTLKQIRELTIKDFIETTSK